MIKINVDPLRNGGIFFKNRRDALRCRTHAVVIFFRVCIEFNEYGDVALLGVDFDLNKNIEKV